MVKLTPVEQAIKEIYTDKKWWVIIKRPGRLRVERLLKKEFGITHTVNVSRIVKSLKRRKLL